ncbi:MAG: tetratricopeptide repeat protein [Rhodospirillales bacterium]|nr:tetratricopeptide repeat protein [Rhodospirillales bacterium]
MRGRQFFFFAVVAAVVLAGASGAAAQIKEDPRHVRNWNAFADNLYKAHRLLIAAQPVRTSEKPGGYAGRPNTFREVEYRAAGNGRLLSRILWQRDRPDTVHVIEIFFYDERGRLSVDYSASYLLEYRNAPAQTLINIHSYEDGLHAFRQFDASGDRIYESCRGDYFDTPVDVSLDEGGSPESEGVPEDLYTTCFGFLPLTVDKYLDPVAFVGGLKKADAAGNSRADGLQRWVAKLSKWIGESSDPSALYLKRGDALFKLNRHAEAVADYTTALNLNDTLDKAYYGRGMALGRLGDLEAGIADLTVFLQRHPDSSLGYTKRGVRYIWKRDFVRAKADLTRAIELDDKNAEAHDDLGVVLAQDGQLEEAIAHFLKVRQLDPTYQKAYHNLAMAYYLSGRHSPALEAADGALKLNPDTKGTLMLKANILDALGRTKEAAAVKDKADFLPDGNWSERSAVR